MSTFRIKPSRAGLIVRDPETRRPLAAEGEEKPRETYWLRRLADGDVVELEPVPVQATPAKPVVAPKKG